ncbi:MAG: histidine phosphatase family protein [Muricomes sp.]|uniref:histidine phosphatase family protein n=1 Tax=Faecalicatena contorta TaxID=39482 RepID=UPI002EC7A4C7|nr:histidine phosphatase family protein [Muricomes sp.]
MRTKYLIRHCEPDFPDRRKVCLSTLQDYPLIENVMQAGDALGRLYFNTDREVVISSDTLRSRQTGKRILKPDEKMYVEKRLMEINPSRRTGLSFGEIKTLEAEYFTKRHWKIECLLKVGEIYVKYEVPDRVRRHCYKVAEVAVEIAGQLKVSGCLLNIRSIYLSALTHDIARTHQNHPKVAAEWMMREGYPEEAGIILEHHELNPLSLKALSEKMIVYLADKYVREDQLVNMEKRFELSLKKCQTPEAVKKHQMCYQQAVMIEKLILSKIA